VTIKFKTGYILGFCLIYLYIVPSAWPNCFVFFAKLQLLIIFIKFIPIEKIHNNGYTKYRIARWSYVSVKIQNLAG